MSAPGAAGTGGLNCINGPNPFQRRFSVQAFFGRTCRHPICKGVIICFSLQRKKKSRAFQKNEKSFRNAVSARRTAALTSGELMHLSAEAIQAGNRETADHQVRGGEESYFSRAKLSNATARWLHPCQRWGCPPLEVAENRARVGFVYRGKAAIFRIVESMMDYHGFLRPGRSVLVKNAPATVLELIVDFPRSHGL